MRVNNSGRTYKQGKALSSEVRENIIDSIKDKGGDVISGNFPGKFIDVANEFKVCSATVSKLWHQYCTTSDLNPKHGGGNRRGLSDGDLQLIEVLKRQRPSITYSEIMDDLQDFGDLPEGGTSKTAVCEAVKNKLPSGPFTFKKTSKIAQERFTITNMAYTQLFVDYLYQKDPYILKYFDECGIKLPDNGARKYGHAPLGERAIEVCRYGQTANTTVNLMCGLTGVTYVNTVQGPSNTLEFLRFFEEAYNSINPLTLRPCLDVGDVIVMDNCPFHHNEGGEILREFFDDLNIELVYMPGYSPDFNPAEYVFGKLKTLLSYRFLDRTNSDLINSLYTAINFITPGDMHEFFKITGYIDV